MWDCYLKKQLLDRFVSLSKNSIFGDSFFKVFQEEKKKMNTPVSHADDQLGNVGTGEGVAVAMEQTS